MTLAGRNAKPGAAAAKSTVMPPVPEAVKALIKDDEKVIRVATIHWGIYWKAVAVAFIAILLLITPAVFNLGVFLAGVTVIMAGLAWLTKSFLLLVLTDKRVFLRHGILRVDTIQIRHSRIESVETEKPLMGQILGYAAVVIYGTGSRQTAIPYIADALAFRNELDEMLSRYEDRAAGAAER